MRGVFELHFRQSPPRSACSAIRSVDDTVQRILNEMGEYIVAELLCGNAPECSRSVR